MSVFSARKRIILARVLFGTMLTALLVSDTAWSDYLLVEELLPFAGWVLIAFGTVGRVWCASYISGHKTVSLMMLGPYSTCRNPLYYYSFVAGSGVMLTSATILLPAGFALVFWLYHPHVIGREERRLREIHGAAYDEYCARVPRFWPNWRLLEETSSHTMDPQRLRQHLREVKWFIIAGAAITLLRHLHGADLLPVYFIIY